MKLSASESHDQCAGKQGQLSDKEQFLQRDMCLCNSLLEMSNYTASPWLVYDFIFRKDLSV